MQGLLLIMWSVPYAAMAILEDEAFYRESLKNNAASTHHLSDAGTDEPAVYSISRQFRVFQSRRDIRELIEEMKQEKVLIT